MNNYDAEVKQHWGETDAYKKHTEKTAGYSKDQWQAITDGLMTVLAKFAACMKDGHVPDSAEALALVKKLQNYITENYYTCTNEILAGLGQMYVADERFKNNIDKHATAPPSLMNPSPPIADNIKRSRHTVQARVAASTFSYEIMRFRLRFLLFFFRLMNSILLG